MLPIAGAQDNNMSAVWSIFFRGKRAAFDCRRTEQRKEVSSDLSNRRLFRLIARDHDGRCEAICRDVVEGVRVRAPTVKLCCRRTIERSLWESRHERKQ